VNLEDLRERRRREREQDSLQALPESFYADVADYVAELKAAREQAAEAAADPYGDPEVRRLTDELQTVQSVVESLYERRVGKVVKGASFAAADMPHEREGLTEEERALFDDLVDRIKENRTRVLDRLAGEGEPTDDGETDRTVASDPAPRSTGGRAEATDESPEPDPAGMLADAMGGADDRPDAEAAAAADPGEPATLGADDVADPGPEGGPSLDEAGDDETAPDGTGDDGADERTTVRITADVGEIYGVDDRSYRLEREDVVDLPADNAAPLVEKDAAERL
jgi:DNA replication factor GINS